MVLGWRVSGGRYGWGSLGRHFPCRDTSADLNEVVFARTVILVSHRRLPGLETRVILTFRPIVLSYAMCQLYSAPHTASRVSHHPMGRLGGALSGPASGSVSGIVGRLDRYAEGAGLLLNQCIL